ncbi:MAG: hypothetical protein HQK50_09580 [Oligoflexia bacterium]|nr:hypothetical protein [Oligoflexia bacterium]MBF0365812.1 hypothetical protein [Oligoflexia bacterium]
MEFSTNRSLPLKFTVYFWSLFFAITMIVALSFAAEAKEVNKINERFFNTSINSSFHKGVTITVKAINACIPPSISISTHANPVGPSIINPN